MTAPERPSGLIIPQRELIPDTPYLTPAAHTELVHETSTALRRAVEHPDFTEAVRLSDAHVGDTRNEALVIAPSRTDAASNYVRGVCDLYLDDQFARKDGDEPAETRLKLAPWEGTHHRLVMLRHTIGKPTQLQAGLSLLGPQAGQLLPSLAEMPKIWDIDLRHAIARTAMPDETKTRLPDDFLESDKVWDIVLAGLNEDVRGSGFVLTALYRAALGVVADHGGEYITGIMDASGIHDPLAKWGPKFWTQLAGTDRRTVLTRVEDSNISCASVGAVERWRQDTKQNRRIIHDMLWGSTLTTRSGVDFTNVERPLIDVIPPNPRFAPEALARRPYDGEAYLLMDLPAVGENVAAFGESLPGVDVHYAMKCNDDGAVLETVRSHGGGFEVASYGELEKLMGMGVNPRDVLFSNPVKKAEDVRKAAQAGLYRFAFDSADELEMIAEVAQAYNLPELSVYLRLATNANDSAVGSEGKFGAHADEAVSLMQKAKTLGLVPYGLTFHVGSQVEDPQAWRTAIDHSGTVMRELEEHGIRIDMLDMGGGFPGPHSRNTPKLSDICDVIMKSLEGLPYMPNKLAVEPGRGLVSNAGVIVCSVINIRERGVDKRVITDLGPFVLMEVLESGGQMAYPTADSRNSMRRATQRAYANSCDSADTLGMLEFSQHIRRGDRSFIYGTGAYTNVYAPAKFNGIEPLPVRYTT